MSYRQEAFVTIRPNDCLLSKMLPRRLPQLACWVSSLLLLLSSSSIQAYPILLQVEEDTERCFQFQIPAGDEAHLVGTTLPTDLPANVEAWFFDQLYKLSAQKDRVIEKNFVDEQPDYVARAVSHFFQSDPSVTAAPLTVGLTNRPGDRAGENLYSGKYFSPLVVNFIHRTTHTRSGRQGIEPDEDIDGYGLCIRNKSTDKFLQFVVDIIMVNEELPSDLNAQQSGFNKERHLTPLEESLDESIEAAETILKEMRYMEKRERRMRRTSESINSRVHWFSYLSISVLLAVTYIQVTYLKRYFHKKKLM